MGRKHAQGAYLCPTSQADLDHSAAVSSMSSNRSWLDQDLGKTPHRSTGLTSYFRERCIEQKIEQGWWTLDR